MYLIEVKDTSLVFSLNSSLAQNLCMNNEGSIGIRFIFNICISLRYIEPRIYKLVCKTSEKSIRRWGEFSFLQEIYNITPQT